MKNTKTCPKCDCNTVIRIDGSVGAYGAGNNIAVTTFTAINVNRYICCRCGYSEEWIDREDLPKIVNSKKAKPIY